MLLRRTAEGIKLIEEDRHRCVADGDLYSLAASDATIGVAQVLQGNVKIGIRLLEEAIFKQDDEGYRGAADWYRLILADVYLQIIVGNEKPPLLTLLKNLPILLKVMVTASSRIRALTTSVQENPRFDPAGHFLGRAHIILGLLYKTKRKPVLALQHLTEAKRIIARFGQTPMLTRIDAALAELG